MSKVPASAFPDAELRHAAEMVMDHRPSDAVEWARRSKVGIDAIGPQGDTLLLLAVGNNDLAMVNALLAARANPNIPVARAPVAVAAEKAGIDVMRALLTAGAMPDGSAGSETALWRAALAGRMDVVELLARSGAKLNEGNADGDTPLIAAVQADHYRMALLLLQLGESPFIASEGGYTAGYWITRSRIPASSEEGQARASLIQQLKAAGFPWPPPSPDDVVSARSRNNWPPR